MEEKKTEDFEKAEKPDKSGAVAKAALGVSLAAALFSFFQWWNSDREARINGAIEVSKQFLTPKDVLALGAITIPLTTERERDVIRTQALQLEYLAYLMNNDRLDERYVAKVIKCQIAVMLMLGLNSASNGLNGPLATEEMAKANSRMGPNLTC